MCKNNCAKCNKFYIIEKPLPSEFKCAKTFSKFVRPKCVLKKKEKKMRKFSLKASVQNFFSKIEQPASFCYRLSKELKKVKIQWLEAGLNIDLVGSR